jgi:pimeloyl-ACP methyl ester carboxylesterase
MTTTRWRWRHRPRAHRAAALRLGAVRLQLAVLERVAPRVAGARAVALWCTLPANAGRRKDFRPGPGEVVELPARRGGRLVAEVWGTSATEERPTVYLVHGWGGWRGQLGAFVQPLVDAGYRVVGFDGPSHGDSDPGVMGRGKGTLIEVTEALEVVGDHFGPAAGVIAHSMGCTVAAMAVRDSLTADRLVLVAPNHDFAEITDDFAVALHLSDRTLGLLRGAIEEFVGRPLSDFDLEPLGADGALPPTLLIHDRRDKETPYQVSATLAASWPEAELLTTDGLGHQRILLDEATVAAAVGHLTGRVAETVRH